MKKIYHSISNKQRNSLRILDPSKTTIKKDIKELKKISMTYKVKHFLNPQLLVSKDSIHFLHKEVTIVVHICPQAAMFHLAVI